MELTLQIFVLAWIFKLLPIGEPIKTIFNVVAFSAVVLLILRGHL